MKIISIGQKKEVPGSIFAECFFPSFDDKDEKGKKIIYVSTLFIILFLN